jgi:hypothetical protein
MKKLLLASVSLAMFTIASAQHRDCPTRGLYFAYGGGLTLDKATVSSLEIGAPNAMSNHYLTAVFSYLHKNEDTYFGYGVQLNKKIAVSEKKRNLVITSVGIGNFRESRTDRTGFYYSVSSKYMQRIYNSDNFFLTVGANYRQIDICPMNKVGIPHKLSLEVGTVFFIM